MSAAPFIHRFTVALHDTDAAGVVFFAHLLRRAHDAWEALLDQAGMPLAGFVTGPGPRLPVVRAELEFSAALRHGDRIAVRIGLARLGRRSFTLGYRFEDGSGRERARACTVHVAVDPRAGVSTALPPDLRALLDTLPAHPAAPPEAAGGDAPGSRASGPLSPGS